MSHFEGLGFEELVPPPELGEPVGDEYRLAIYTRDGLGEVYPGGDVLLALNVVGWQTEVFRQGGGGGLGPLSTPHEERAKFGFLLDLDVGGRVLRLRVLRAYYSGLFDVRVRLGDGREGVCRRVPGVFIGRGRPGLTDIEPRWLVEPV